MLRLRRAWPGGPLSATEPPPSDAASELSSFSPPASSGLQRLALAQVSLGGALQKLRGGASTELADTAFYSQQVAELIGDALGLGSCRVLAFEGREESIIIFRGRNITGVRGSHADLVFVRDGVSARFAALGNACAPELVLQAGTPRRANPDATLAGTIFSRWCERQELHARARQRQDGKGQQASTQEAIRYRGAGFGIPGETRIPLRHRADGVGCDVAQERGLIGGDCV